MFSLPLNEEEEMNIIRSFQTAPSTRYKRKKTHTPGHIWPTKYAFITSLVVVVVECFRW